MEWNKILGYQLADNSKPYLSNDHMKEFSDVW